MAAMGAHVLEVEGDDLRALKPQLGRLPEVISAAQLGSRLRVLVQNAITDPVGWLRVQSLQPSPGRIEQVRPSLEDVFVTSTGRSSRASNGDDRDGMTGNSPTANGHSGNRSSVSHL
jgi:ABC-2 type transport system ATP-binding protein